MPANSPDVGAVKFKTAEPFTDKSAVLANINVTPAPVICAFELIFNPPSLMIYKPGSNVTTPCNATPLAKQAYGVPEIEFEPGVSVTSLKLPPA